MPFDSPGLFQTGRERYHPPPIRGRHPGPCSILPTSLRRLERRRRCNLKSPSRYDRWNSPRWLWNVLIVAGGLSSLLGFLYEGGAFGDGHEAGPRLVNLNTSFMILFAGILGRRLLRPEIRRARGERIRKILGPTPGRGARLILGLLLVQSLLLPLALGYGAGRVAKAALFLAERTSSNNPLLGVHERAGPRPLLEEVLAEVPPDQSLLLAGSRSRNLRGFILAYYLYPRPLYMHLMTAPLLLTSFLLCSQMGM